MIKTRDIYIYTTHSLIKTLLFNSLNFLKTTQYRGFAYQWDTNSKHKTFWNNTKAKHFIHHVMLHTHKKYMCAHTHYLHSWLHKQPIMHMQKHKLTHTFYSLRSYMFYNSCFSAIYPHTRTTHDTHPMLN